MTNYEYLSTHMCVHESTKSYTSKYKKCKEIIHDNNNKKLLQYSTAYGGKINSAIPHCITSVIQ